MLDARRGGVRVGIARVGAVKELVGVRVSVGIEVVAGQGVGGTKVAVFPPVRQRIAVGVSIFWNTAIDPLRFNFSKAIQKESYDREQTFDLTISTQF